MAFQRPANWDRAAPALNHLALQRFPHSLPLNNDHYDSFDPIEDEDEIGNCMRFKNSLSPCVRTHAYKDEYAATKDHIDGQDYLSVHPAEDFYEDAFDQDELFQYDLDGYGGVDCGSHVNGAAYPVSGYNEPIGNYYTCI